MTKARATATATGAILAIALFAVACSVQTDFPIASDDQTAGDSIDTAGAESAEPAPPAPLDPSRFRGPQANIDHWHAVYGVYNCNLPGAGEAKYLPPFQSTKDDTGLHSHGDGLIHIHPFFQLAAEEKAVFGHWFNEMQVEITRERIVVSNQFDPPAELIAGEECADGTGRAEIKLLRWLNAAEAVADPRVMPTVVNEGFGNQRFLKDREVFIFAYVGENTDLAALPLPSRRQFAQLDNVSAAIEFDLDDQASPN